MKRGDLVLVIKGYTLQPAPKTGDIGIIVEESGMFLGCVTDVMIMIGRLKGVWRCSPDALEVICKV